MKLVKNVSSLGKAYSNWAAAAVFIVAGIQSQWGEVFSKAIPEQYQPIIYAVLALVAIVGRAVDQGLGE